MDTSRHNEFSQDEDLVYDHWLKLVEEELPEPLIQRFYELFIQGADYDDRDVYAAVQRLVRSPISTVRFKFVLNRSSYILINRWWMQPYRRNYIPQLIDQFYVPTQPLTNHANAQRLHDLVQMFCETPECHALHHFAKSIRINPDTAPEDAPLRDFAHRYPYLHEFNFLAGIIEQIAEEQRQTIMKRRQEEERQLETNLALYLTHRQVQQRRGEGYMVTSPQDELGNIIQGVHSDRNPTWLRDAQLDAAIRHFAGNFHGNASYHGFARQFSNYSRETRNLRSFKRELYSYLTTGCQSQYARMRFNPRLEDCLNNLFPQGDQMQVNDTLIINACQRILRFLIFDVPEHIPYRFAQWTEQLGYELTVGLVLKIVLFCERVKAYAEKQLGNLFRHYEHYRKNDPTIRWLVESSEYFNVAFTVHFGKRPASQWLVV